MRSTWPVCLRTFGAAGVVAVLAVGCGDAVERDVSPKPRTVVVEKTVEVTARAKEVEETTVSALRSSGEKTCEVGRECDLGESSVTVTGSEQVQTITAVGETYEGDFVVVEYDYTYGGNSPTDLGEPPFGLRDGDGNTYSLNFDASSSYEIENDMGAIYETVQPGVTVQGAAVFEVAPGAQDFTLLIEDLVSPRASASAEVPLRPGDPLSGSSGGASEGQQADAAGSSLDSFVSSYYEAVGREDWAATYSMLDSESRTAFTEDEWTEKQTARNAAASPPPLAEAVVNGVVEQGSGQFVNVTLVYEDGSQETLDIEVRAEDGEYKRHLTASEMEFLQTL